MLSEPGWEYVFSERAHGRVKKLGPGLQYSLTGRDWKYFHATEQPDELYDLRADPLELRNVVEEYPEVARRLREEILSRVAGAIQRDPTAVDSLPADYVDQLRALGYVD
jgi:arylsulfatase A-like enzyme